jgi:hypothetical protein
MKLTTTAILILALTGSAIGILAPAANAVPQLACSDRLQPSCPDLVCAGTPSGVRPVCVEDPCRVVDCATLARPYCIEGQPNCPAGEILCVFPDTLQVCFTDPCYTTACYPPEASPTCETLSEGIWAAGVTWSNCIHVSGYVCVQPTYYGGHGIWGFECSNALAFGLP